MIAKQLSVFIENRKGRLTDVLGVLKENNVNILSLSLADTTEYGLLRLIVSDAVLSKEKLSAAGFSTILSDVFVVKISHATGSLQTLSDVLAKGDINVEYMYGLSIKGADAFVVVKTSDIQKAEKIMTEAGVVTVSSQEIAKL